MTLDDLDLAAAMRDLAARLPDDPTRLASVHFRYRRHRRRRRALGASALVATMAAGIVGAESLASSGRRINPAAAGVSTLPACPPPPVEQSSGRSAPPTIGQTFSGGGLIVALGRSTITVDDVGGPLRGKVTLTVTPDTKLFRSSPQSKLADVATTIDQLGVGDTVKFTAVHSSATTNTLVELHTGPATGASPAGPTQATPDQTPTAPPVGGSFKAEGTVTAYSPGLLTVNVARGNVTGTVTFSIRCAPPLPVVGHIVDVSGTRTLTDTYEADHFALATP
jgi:hypothetical protein